MSVTRELQGLTGTWFYRTRGGVFSGVVIFAGSDGYAIVSHQDGSDRVRIADLYPSFDAATMHAVADWTEHARHGDVDLRRAARAVVEAHDRSKGEVPLEDIENLRRAIGGVA